MAARILTALTHGTFFGVGSVVATRLVPADRRASAIALMFTGLAVDAASALIELGRDGAGFDLVFSDVVMPRMSGIELAQEITRRLPHIPVVLTSGYSSVLAEQESHNFELLRKPYSLEELAKVLARVSARD